MVKSIFALCLFFIATVGLAQTTTYSNGGLVVEVTASHPCEGANNGSLVFRVISTADNLPAKLQLIFGPPHLFAEQSIPVGSSYTHNPSSTLPVEDYEFIISDNSESDVITTFGSGIGLSALPDISSVDDASLDLTNSTCVNPDGQIAVTISGGSKVLAGGGSFTYTWTTDNGLSGFPVTGTTDGTSVLNLASIAGRPGLPGGNYTLVLEDNFSSCSETRSWTITDPQPTIRNISNSGVQQICLGGNGLVVLGSSENGVTYEVLIDGVPTGITQVGNGADLNFNIPSGLLANGQVLTVRGSLLSCTPILMTGSITIQINQPAIVEAGSAQDLCAGQNATLTGASVSGSATTGAWSIFSQPVGGNGILSSTAQTANPASVTFTATQPGSYILRLQSNNPPGPCPFVTDDVTITVSAAPLVAAGADAPICAGDSYTLSGASIGGTASTAAWSIFSQPVGGNGALSSTAQSGNPESVTFTATIAGNYTLRLTTNDPAGTCGPATDDIIINVSAAPIANAGADRTVCATTTVTLTGSSVSGSATTGAWSIVSQPGGGNGALSSTAQTATPNTVTFSATVAGAYTLRLTTNAPSGPCPVDTDDVIITLNNPATVFAGNDAPICASTAYALTGATIGGSATTGAWAITGQPSGGNGALSTTAQTSNPAAVTFSASVAGNYTLRLTTNNPAGPCNAVNDVVVITVNPAPLAIAGGTQNICSGETVNLTGSSIGGAATNASWAIVGQPALGDGILSSVAPTATPSNVTFTATVAGTYTLRLTTNDPVGPCPADTDDVVITVNSLATVNAGSDSPACASSPFTLASSSIGGSASTGAWSIVSQPVSGDGVLSSTAQTTTPATITFTASVLGAYTLRLTTDDPAGSCTSVSDDVIITIEPAALAIAGAPQEFCSGSSITLTGATLGGAATTGAWSIIDQPTSGDGVLSSGAQTATPSAITFSASVAGSYTLQLTTNDPAGPCPAATDQVVITVAPLATVDAGIDNPACAGTAYTLAGSTIGGVASVGTWTIVTQPLSGDGVLSSGAATSDPASITFNATVIGPYTLRLTTDDPTGACGPVSDDVDITIQAAPTVNAGPDQGICTGEVYNLSGASIGGSATTAAWSILTQPVGGDGNLSTTAQTATPALQTFSATVTGVYRLRLTTEDPAGACGSIFDEVDLTVGPGAIAIAGADNPACANLAYTLAGASVAGSATTGAWSISSQPVGGDGLLNNSLQTANPSAVTFTATIPGAYTLTLTTNDPAGSCAAASDNVIITVEASPVADAGDDQAICIGEAYGLAGSTIGGSATSGAWSIVSQPPTGDGLLSSTAQTSNPSGVTFSATVIGVYTLRLTTDPASGVCPVGTDEVIITVGSGANATAGSDDSMCGGTTYTLAGAAVSGAATTGAWTIVNQPPLGDGLLSDNTHTASPNSITFTATTVGAYTLRLTTNDPAGSCTAVFDEVVISVDNAPIANAPADQGICNTETLTLTGASVSGTASTGAWSIFDQPTGGDGILSSTAQTSNPETVTFAATVSGVYTLRLTTDSPGGSCAAGTDDMIVTVVAPAVAIAGPDDGICANIVYTFTAASIGGGATTGTWSIMTQPLGGDGILSDVTAVTNPSAVTFTATVPGPYTLRLSTDDPAGNCTVATDEITLTIFENAVVNAGPDNQFCAGEIFTLGGASFGGSAASASWSIFSQPGSGDGLLSSTASTVNPETITFTATVAGVYVLRLTTDDPAGICEAVVDEITLTVTGSAIANAGADDSMCVGETYPLAGTISGGATTGAWSIVTQPMGGDGTLSDTNPVADPSTITFTASVLGTYTLRLTTDDPAGTCTLDTDDVTIVVNTAPTVDAGGDKSLCAGAVVDFTGASFGGAAVTAAWSIVSQPTGGDGNLSDDTHTASPATVTFSATTVGSYTLRLTTNDPGGSCDAAIDELTITVTPGAIADAGQDRVACAGSPIVMTGASVSGSASTGAWTIVGQPVGGDGILSSTSQTSNPESITFSATIAGVYTLSLMTDDPAGQCLEGVDEVAITILNGLNGGLNLEVTNPTVCINGFTDIVVESSEIGVSYQLRNNADDSPIGATVTGSGGDIVLSTGPLAATTTFNVLATLAGCTDVELAETVTVNVNGSINSSFTLTADNATICEGTATNIVMSDSETGVTYQLRNDADDSPIGVAQAGNTGNPLSFPIDPITVTTTYNVLATIGTCSIQLGETETVTVSPAVQSNLTVTASPSPLCVGGIASILVENSQIGVSYQLRNDADDSPIGSAVMGTSGNIELLSGPLATTTTFNILATGGAGCAPVELTTKPTVVVNGTIDATLDVTVLSNPICSGSASTIRITSSEVGVTYDLRNESNNAITASAVGTGADLDIATGNLAATTTFNILASNGTCSIELVTKPVVDVDALPDATIPVSAVITSLCVGGQTEIQVENSETGIVYQLRNDADDSNVGAAQVGDGSTLSFTTGTLNATTAFNVIATGGAACPQVELATVVTVTVGGNVDPSITVTIDPSTVCSGTSASVEIQGSEAGVTYQLRNDADNALIGAAVAGGGDISLPTGNLTTNTTFNVLASNGACAIELFTTVSATVTAGPSATLAVTANPATLCAGQATNIVIVSSENGVSYQLRNDADDTFVGSAVTGNGSNLTINVSNIIATTSYNVLATLGGCSVELAQKPTVTVRAANDPACTGGTGCFAFTILQDETITQRPSCASQNDGVLSWNISGIGTQFQVSLLINGVSVTPPDIGGPRKVTYSNLSPASYTLSVVDNLGNACTQNFDFLVETTVKATSNTVTNSSCFGQPLGVANLTVTGGNSPYEYSIDGGSTWVTNYVSGNNIENLAVGSYNILVRDNVGDNCPAEVAITIGNEFPQIEFQIATTAVSTCGAADGKINLSGMTGGSGMKQARLLEITGTGNIVVQDFTDVNGTIEFANRTNGSYIIEVRDQVGCIVSNSSSPAVITTPGAVNYTLTPVDADCSNQGNSGAVLVNFDAPGTFEIGVGQDQGIEPEYFTYNVTPGTPVILDELSRGNYFVFVKPVSGASCPSVQPAMIEGAYAIDFDIQRVCFAESSPSVNLVNVVGQPGAQMTIQVYRLSNLADMVDEFTVPTNDVITITHEGEPAGTPHNWLIDADSYVIKAFQNQAFCPGETVTPFHEETYTASQPMSMVIENIKQSMPDPRHNGGFRLRTINGGIPLSDEDNRPYFVVTLLDPSSNTPIMDPVNVYRNAQLNYQYDFRNLPVGNFVMEVVDNNGCEATTVVIIPAETRIIIPNIFTPNNDTVNDLFEIVNLPEGGSHKLVVSNRWGKEVYSSSNYHEGAFWDAEGTPDGIYFYRLQVSGDKTYTGWVEILRGSKP